MIDVPRESSVIPASPAEDAMWNAVGTIRLPIARARREEAVWATVVLKFCSTRLKPPAMKAIPRTRSLHLCFESVFELGWYR